MKPALILILGIVIATVVISLIIKAATKPKSQWIRGMQCSRCAREGKKSKVRWAGYKDRKICQRGHIFT
jgi:hypothetical protein